MVLGSYTDRDRKPTRKATGAENTFPWLAIGFWGGNKTSGSAPSGLILLMPHHSSPHAIVVSALLILVACSTGASIIVDSTSALDKVILGYQGWFVCAGDSK